MTKIKAVPRWEKEGFKSQKEFDQWRVDNKVQREDFERSPLMEALISFADFMVYEIPPGPAFMPFRCNVNFAKLAVTCSIFAMMVYYDNFSTAAWIYFCLHGSYGVFWVMKDVMFPDVGFCRKQTLLSMLFAYPSGILLYPIPAWQVMSRRAP